MRAPTSEVLARHDSGGILPALVGDAATFTEKVYGNEPWFRATGASRLPRLELAEVDALLSSALLRRPFFRLVQDGATLPPAAYTRSVRLSAGTSDGVVEAARVLDLMAGGATLVLESAHRFVPALARWCTDLALDLELPTQANVYITPAGSQGFAPHVDSHDVFVIHLHGSKQWTIGERSATLPHPVRSDRGRLNTAEVVDSPTAARWDFVPGSVAYLPRGFPHAAAAGGDGVSMHVTVGLVPPTLDEVAREVAGSRAEGHRRRVPVPGSLSGTVDPEVDLGGPIARPEYRAVLARRLVASLTTPTGRLLASAPCADPAALTLGPAAVVLERPGRSGAALTLVLPDRELDFEAHVAPAAEAVLRAAASAEGLAGRGLSGLDARLAAGLVDAGVLAPAPGGNGR